MKLFRLESANLKELKENQKTGRPFDYEKTMQTLIEHNLNTIFNGLEFVKTEHQIGQLRPDTIAFDNNRNSFAIIEYKNVGNEGVVDQGMSYYKLLQEKKGEFVLLYHKIKGKLLDIEKINWDDTRVIFIAPEFTVHQIRASSSIELPIELYEIKNYENGIIALKKIEGQEEGYTESNAKGKEKRVRVSLPAYNEADYLSGKYAGGTLNPSQQVKELWSKLKYKILENFSKIEFKQMKKYAGFYSKEDGSLICTIEASKSKIKLVYTTRKKHGVLTTSDFVRDVSDVGHWGVGDYQSIIENDTSIDKTIPLLRKVYQSKGL